MRRLLMSPITTRILSATLRTARRAPRAMTACLLAACAGAADVTGSTGSGTGAGGSTQSSTPSRIDLSVTQMGLGAVGASETVTAWVRDASGNALGTAPVAWSSADITIADVSGSGNIATVTARAPGRTTIRATSGSLVQELAVTVTTIRSIQLPANPRVRAGSTLLLTPTLDAGTGASTALRWESETPTIATVSNGIVTGVQSGTATIRAIAVGDPRVSAAAQVTVTLPRSVAIRGVPQDVFVGDEPQLSAVLDVDDGESRAVEWSSSAPTVATITSSGKLVTVGPGSATIRVRSVAFDGVRDSAVVEVRRPRIVTVSPASSVLTNGETMQLTAAVQIDAGMSTAVLWRVTNPAVVMVSSNGLVTAIAQGTATVTAISVADTTRRGQASITVVPAVRSVTVQPEVASVGMGATRQLTATIVGDVGVSPAVIWRTANPTVAQISQTGVVTGVALGSTTITAIAAADTTRRATATVTVVAVAREVEVLPGSSSINVGATRQFTATVIGTSGTSQAVTWRTANPAVASVSTGGVVTGVAQGTTTVTAVSVADTTLRGTATVTIVPIVRTVTVQPSAAAINIGEARQLTQTVTADAGASTAVTWRSANPAVASVSQNGVVSGVSAGSVPITVLSVADTTRQATSLITVRAAPEVAVSPSTLTLEPGTSGALSVSVQADAGVSTAVTWRTSNAAVATVSSTGQVAAVADGSTTITAISVADTTRRASATVTVRTSPRVLGVSVTPSTVALTAGQTVQLVPAVQVSGGASTAVTYRSDNPGVASVNFGGLVSAIANGSATITVSSTADPARTATAVVTVATAPAPARLATSWSSARLAGALHEDVVSIDGVDAGNAFAVNSTGDVYRLSGGSWALAVRGSTFSTRFLAVSATATANAVAVGTNGTIVRFDGSTWTRMTSGTPQTLNGVHLESATTGFAVGASGVVLRLNSGSWASIASGTSRTLNGVWTSGSTGFAVGATGEVIRWNGTTWSRVASGTTNILYGVSGISATNAVAVGAMGTVLRWNGTAWSRVSATNVTADLYNVAGSTANNNRYYFASDDGLYALDNSTASAVATPYAPRLFGTAIDGAGNVWTSGQRGSVMRLSGATWETVSLTPDLIDVWTTAANNAWAVGEYGFVYRWNGSSWTRQNTPTMATLNAVWGASGTDAFAGGDNGTMLRWNGSSWSSMSVPSSGNIYGIWGSAASNVYAVTSNGEVLRFNGSSWSTVTTASGALWAVFGTAANDVYVSGENGAALRFNGTAWSTITVPGGGTMAGIWASAPGSLMAVGTNSSGLSGVAFRYASSSWSSLSLPALTVLTSVWGTGASDVYATGANGTILRWNGTSWSAMSSGTTDQLWSVSGLDSGAGGFAVGYNSTVATAAGGSSLMMAGMRTAGTARATSLEPGAGATLTRGPLPSGTERRNRKHWELRAAR